MSLDGCECEHLSPHVTYMSAPCSDFPLAFLLLSVAQTSASLHLSHLGLRDPTCSPQALPRLLLHWGLPLRGPGTEGLAGWLLVPAAGLQTVLAPWNFIFASIWEPRPPGDRFSVPPWPRQRPRATPPGRSSSSPRCGPPRAVPAAFCLPSFYPRAAGGPGLGEVWCGEKPRSWWSGRLACSWREEAQVSPELWPPGFPLLLGLRQDTLLVRASPPQP